jgi:DNA polymerase-3 subunit delta'
MTVSNRALPVPLFGHEGLRDQLRNAAAEGRLPGSLLLHGPRGVGKQRLALWLGQLLLCAGTGERPCGKCQQCRYASALVHPDLHWFFPRPRLKDPDPSAEAVAEDYGEAIAERVERRGLYPPTDGTEAIFVAVVRALLQQAALTPALARRKVFVIGDADRMVPQEGAEQAANAFLKLLEEPPADTTLVLTSSEPGALLPTVRSRVVAIRVAPLPEKSVRQFLADPAVVTALSESGAPAPLEERLRLAQGSPGVLFGASGLKQALDEAARLLVAATRVDAAESLRLAFIQGSSRARGHFTQVLDALTLLLNQRLREFVRDGDDRASGAAKALGAVEKAKLMAAGNVNPQLVTAALVRQIGTLIR